MTYLLAQKLRDSGFPQGATNGEMYFSREGRDYLIPSYTSLMRELTVVTKFWSKELEFYISEHEGEWKVSAESKTSTKDEIIVVDNAVENVLAETWIFYKDLINAHSPKCNYIQNRKR